MAEETVEFEGKSYVPSKQASKATGYTQDYIGQLARGNSILARRIGGLWYIHMDSLVEHKKQSEAYVPEPPVQITDNGGSIVSFDGREYISSKRAAEMTRYTQDYVGQLARGGKIASRQVSGRWYVSKDDIKAHKQEKDALLAKVQTEAVGIAKSESNIPRPDRELFTYITEDHSDIPALPVMIKKEPKLEQETVSRSDISEISSSEREENMTHHIAIRAMSRDAEAAQLVTPSPIQPIQNPGYSQYRSTWGPERSSTKVKRGKSMTFVFAVLLFAGALGYFATTGVVSSLFVTGPTASTMTAQVGDGEEGTVMSAYQDFTDSVLRIFGGELSYTRKD